MARPNLVRPDQPLPIQWALHVYQFAASIKLAVVLILWLAFTFAMGTFVEAAYGTPVAQYTVYQTAWFNLLLVLLAVNIFCAAAIRFPFKRHQTGFVITHIGLLTLLAGTAIHRMQGIDAQVHVFENDTGFLAMEDNLHFDLVVHSKNEQSDDALRRSMRRGELDQEKTEVIEPIEFRPGFFSWRDYGRIFTLKKPPNKIGSQEDQWYRKLGRYASGWMFRLAQLTSGSHPNRWVEDDGEWLKARRLYDEDGIQLDVVDFYADSREVQAPMVGLKFSVPRTEWENADGKMVKSRRYWMPARPLSIRDAPGDGFPFGATEKMTAPGGTVSFRMTDRPEELDSFLNTAPEGELGPEGQLILWAGGKATRVQVDKQRETGRFELAGTDLMAEIANYWPATTPPDYNEETKEYDIVGRSNLGVINPAVEIKLYDGDEEEAVSRLVLYSDRPNENLFDYQRNIFGSYWFNHKTKEAKDEDEEEQDEVAEADRDRRRRLGLGNRIELLQFDTRPDDGDAYNELDQQGDEPRFELYYRLFNKEQIVSQGPLPVGGDLEDDSLDGFTMGDPLKFFVEEHVAAAAPVTVRLPNEFKKDNIAYRNQSPAAKVRVTVDDKVHQFWIQATLDITHPPMFANEHVIVEGKDRKVSVILRFDAIDIGARARLTDFERRLDPGTSQAAHYSSTIDLLERYTDRRPAFAALDGGNRQAVTLPVPDEFDTIYNAEDIAVIDDGQVIYWTEQKKQNIWRLDLRGDEPVVTKIGGDEHRRAEPVALVVDEKNGSVFWLEYIPSDRAKFTKLWKANLNGKKAEEVVPFARGRPIDLVFDEEHEQLYWCYETFQVVEGKRLQRGAIARVGVDGEEHIPDLVTGIGVPSSLALDPLKHRLYWTEPKSNAIRSAGLDGADVRSLGVAEDDQRPVSVVVDAKARRIYWVDNTDPPPRTEEEKPEVRPRYHSIWTASLEGSEGVAEAIVTDFLYQPRSLQLIGDGDQKQLWWTEEAVLRKDVWITMNAPIDFRNPINGDAYRIFQESFNGPFKPGNPIYEQRVAKGAQVPEIYSSWLTINHDPGRAVRNAGCMLVVLGIGVMFYMRAYLFRPRRRESRAVTPSTIPRGQSRSDTAATRQDSNPNEPVTAEVVS